MTDQSANDQFCAAFTMQGAHAAYVAQMYTRCAAHPVGLMEAIVEVIG